MIKENSRNKFLETVIEVEVTISGTENEFAEDEAYLDKAFETELGKFNIGIKPDSTTKASSRQIGFRQYHNELKAWTATYEIRITQPVK